MTICIKCKHCSTRNPDKVWYDYKCRAVTHKPRQDPVTGKWRYACKNDLGGSVFADDQHPNARTVNTEGNCILYKGV